MCKKRAIFCTYTIIELNYMDPSLNSTFLPPSSLDSIAKPGVSGPLGKSQYSEEDRRIADVTIPILLNASEINQNEGKDLKRNEVTVLPTISIEVNKETENTGSLDDLEGLDENSIDKKDSTLKPDHESAQTTQESLSGPRTATLTKTPNKAINSNSNILIRTSTFFEQIPHLSTEEATTLQRSFDNVERVLDECRKKEELIKSRYPQISDALKSLRKKDDIQNILDGINPDNFSHASQYIDALDKATDKLKLHSAFLDTFAAQYGIDLKKELLQEKKRLNKNTVKTIDNPQKKSPSVSISSRILADRIKKEALLKLLASLERVRSFSQQQRQKQKKYFEEQERYLNSIQHTAKQREKLNNYRKNEDFKREILAHELSQKHY